MSPTISVIIPCYNDRKMLERALMSVNNQMYDDIEVVIIDSSDNNEIEKLALRSDDLIYEWQPPSGPAAARNLGISKSSGEIIAFLDSDDVWLPDKINIQLNEMLETDSEFSYTDEYVLRDHSLRLNRSIELGSGNKKHVEYFKKGTGIGSRSVMADRECFNRFEFNEELKAREDPNLWTKILKYYTHVRIETPLSIKIDQTGSVTDDVYTVHENEIKSINDLCRTFPELNKYRKQRLRKSKSKLVYNLCERNRVLEAKEEAKKFLNEDLCTQSVGSLLYSYIFHNRRYQNIIRYVYRSIIE